MPKAQQFLPMKCLYMLLGIILGWNPLLAEEFPDIQKSFPKAKLISVTQIDPFNKIMSFGSDESFEELKKQLVSKLGEGWLESKEELTPKPKESIKDLDEHAQPKFNLAGNTVLTNKNFPNTKIRLTVFATKVFKTKNSVLLAIERTKTQKKGA